MEGRREGHRRSSIKSKVININSPSAVRSGLREGNDLPGINSKIKERKESTIRDKKESHIRAPKESQMKERRESQSHLQ